MVDGDHRGGGAPGSLEALLVADAGGLCDEGARLHLLALHAAKARFDAAVVAATDVVERRGLHSVDGARSSAGWLAARVDQTRGRCKGDVRLARALRDMPAVAAAARAGRLGRPKVEQLAEVRTPEVAELFALQEAFLVEELARLRVDAAGRFLRAWQQQARLRRGWTDPDAPVDEHEPRVSVDLSPTFDGRWVLDGEMDAEHGTIIRGAIDAEVDEMFRVGVFSATDGLTPAERRGQALAQVVLRAGRGGVRHGRPRPSIEVICDERTLLGAPITDPDTDGGDDLASRVCELVDGTPVHPVTLGRLLCGARLHRLVVDAGGEVLDAGKDIRLANRAQRRALRFGHARHCAFPGCDAPVEWCEAHHIEEWDPDPDSPSGATDLANLVPLCRFHHHQVHEGGFLLSVDPDGDVHVLRPEDDSGRRRPVTPVRPHRRPVEPHPDVLLARRRVRELPRPPWAAAG